MNSPALNQTGRLPAVYLSHGAPPLIDDPVWSRELTEWGQRLGKPQAILVVSAHWESAPLTIGATTPVLARKDLDGLVNFRQTAPGLRYAHRTLDHFVPLFVALGASLETGTDSASAVEGFWFNNSKRSIELH